MPRFYDNLRMIRALLEADKELISLCDNYSLKLKAELETYNQQVFDSGFQANKVFNGQKLVAVGLKNWLLATNDHVIRDTINSS